LSPFCILQATCGGPYTSGFIHYAQLEHLKPSTEYFYRLGEDNTVSSFTMPPTPGLKANFSFGLIGDLGQTSDSNNTVTHLAQSGADLILHAGDLSYADCLQVGQAVRTPL